MRISKDFRISYKNLIFIVLCVIVSSCLTDKNKMKTEKNLNASEILGNPDFPAICYGGYRKATREIELTKQEIKEDVLILSALGFKVLRTYNVHYTEAEYLLEVIRELKNEDPNFEMYLMLGAWIDCKNARTDSVNHFEESEKNEAEVKKAALLAREFPDIVKIVAVGNEAMVQWATSYYVQPAVILQWVAYLQDLKKNGYLPENLWITSSDNFASWGGGGKEYHHEDLNKLIAAVDYISIHTYPMHDTHYNPAFWGVKNVELELSDSMKIAKAMERSVDYAASQYQNVLRYVRNLGFDKPIHIGETGWASHCNGFYGNNGSMAVDEYKSGTYYKSMLSWCQNNGLTCFYFEAFDEPWKDANNPKGSENHFGLISVEGKVKYAIWDKLDAGLLKGLKRDGKSLSKTFGSEIELLQHSLVPPISIMPDTHYQYR